MCYFITIAVAKGAADTARAAHSGSGMSIGPTRNPAAVAAAGEGRTPLLVTGGGCSCAWYTPPAGREAEARAARARTRYERLGWSRAKIDRALSSMGRTPRPGDGLHPVIVDLLRDLVRAHGRAAVWVHDFTGKVEHEAYAIARREQWAAADLDLRAAALDLDVIVEVKA